MRNPSPLIAGLFVLATLLLGLWVRGCSTIPDTQPPPRVAPIAPETQPEE